MKEVIVDAEDLVCLNKEKLQELIRCKDCRWYMRSKLKGDYTEDMRYKPNYCMWWRSFTKEHDYCSQAERKEVIVDAEDLVCLNKEKLQELIRCKDCRWFDTKDISGTVEPIGYRCKKVARLWREPDDFCKGAERREPEPVKAVKE